MKKFILKMMCAGLGMFGLLGTSGCLLRSTVDKGANEIIARAQLQSEGAARQLTYNPTQLKLSAIAIIGAQQVKNACSSWWIRENCRPVLNAMWPVFVEAGFTSPGEDIRTLADSYTSRLSR